MKKQRAPDLTKERIKIVVEVLDGWSGKLTWEALIEKVQEKTGITYSRFTFAENPRIAAAFDLRKTGLRELRGLKHLNASRRTRTGCCPSQVNGVTSTSSPERRSDSLLTTSAGCERP